MFHVSRSFLKITRYLTLRHDVRYIVKTPAPQQLKYSSPMSSNRGTGAGGSNTNRGGLPFERCICPPVYVVGKGAKVGDFLFLKQYDFIRHMKPVNPKSRLFKPDGAYVLGTDAVILLECKFQSTSGSADEKILNSPTKLELYKQAYPHVKHWRYVLVLSEWFQQPTYTQWLAVLTKNPEISVWWAKRTDEVRVQLEIDETSGSVKVHLTNYQLLP
ncbi:hypothetical protein [Dishui Lake phycodnavirus 2]|nr:hypothetical protein [Dishui Lake phycodnavirus 2]